jgi:hypothetical protein
LKKTKGKVKEEHIRETTTIGSAYGYETIDKYSEKMSINIPNSTENSMAINRDRIARA